jgi:phosphopantothenoylcysteine decarboxylase/phosphopantothenate--cysteine ligase
MDVDMYRNEATQRNLLTLRERGCFILEPETGELASGLSGPGRLPGIDRVVEFVRNIIEGRHRDLGNRRVVVTAGPTQEPIDPVRFLGNRSSGKMGFALANAAALRGADVTLVSGPVSLETPRNTRRIDVSTAAEMLAVVEKEFDAADVLIMAAAVADYAPSRQASTKIKRDPGSSKGMTLELKENPDILQAIGRRKRGQILVGFALETENEVENAKRKLTAKHLDMIVLNNPTEQGAGFGGDTNVVSMIDSQGDIQQLPLLSKFDVANEVLNRVSALLKQAV